MRLRFIKYQDSSSNSGSVPIVVTIILVLPFSHQKKPSDPELSPVATEPPAKRPNTGAPVLGGEEPEDDTVEIEA